MGAQRRGEEVPKTNLFLIGLPVGSPGEPKTTKMEPKGATMTPGDLKNQVLGWNTAPKLCATLGTATTILGSRF